MAPQPICRINGHVAALQWAKYYQLHGADNIGRGWATLYTSVAMAAVGGLSHIFAHLSFCFLCLQIVPSVFGFCYNLLGPAAMHSGFADTNLMQRWYNNKWYNKWWQPILI